MSIIDDFIDSENAKMSRIDRAFLNYPIIKTTSSLSVPVAKGKFGTEKVIRPSLIQRIESVIFLFLLSLVWLLLVKLLFDGKAPWFVVIMTNSYLVLFIIHYHSEREKEG